MFASFARDIEKVKSWYISIQLKSVLIAHSYVTSQCTILKILYRARIFKRVWGPGIDSKE
jgi:hypothetical protein